MGNIFGEKKEPVQKKDGKGTGLRNFWGTSTFVGKKGNQGRNGTFPWDEMGGAKKKT